MECGSEWGVFVCACVEFLVVCECVSCLGVDGGCEGVRGSSG